MLKMKIQTTPTLCQPPHPPVRNHLTLTFLFPPMRNFSLQFLTIWKNALTKIKLIYHSPLPPLGKSPLPHPPFRKQPKLNPPLGQIIARAPSMTLHSYPLPPLGKHICNPPAPHPPFRKQQTVIPPIGQITLRKIHNQDYFFQPFNKIIIISSWFISNKQRNKILHAKNGNRNLNKSLNNGHWNCGKGLLDKDNFASEKVSEIQEFLESNDLDILAVSEA